MSDYYAIFQTNPEAILGASWVSMSDSQTGTNSSTSASVRKELMSPKSSVNSVANEVQEQETICDDASADDYVPISMSSWGSQSDKDSSHSHPPPEQSMDHWKTLVDPYFEPKAGGIGSGNLHRKGSNYKPVDEDSILYQRLRSQLAPSRKSKKPLALKPISSLKPMSSPKAEFSTFEYTSRKKSATLPEKMDVMMIPTSRKAIRGLSHLQTKTTGLAQTKNAPFTSQPFGTSDLTPTPSPLASAPLPSTTSADKPVTTINLSSSFLSHGNNTPGGTSPYSAERLILIIHLELAPGVTIKIPLSEKDEPHVLVNRFSEHHRIDMSKEAKAAMAETLSALKQARLEGLGQAKNV